MRDRSGACARPSPPGTRRKPALTLGGELHLSGVDALDRWAAQALDRLFLLEHLDRLYAQLPPCASPQDFLAQVLKLLEVRCEIDPAELARIPAQGPLVVVANHPFGAIEGLLLAQLLLQRRPDMRLLANSLLLRIAELRELLIPLNPFARRPLPACNARPLRQALRWVRDGGLLAAFPAGAVAHLQADGRIADPAWQPAAIRVAALSGADVLPVYFEGRNSALFQAAGLIHPRLRTAMIPRELLNKRGSRIELRIGRPIAHAHLQGFGDAETATRYVRMRTYLLGRGGPAPLNTGQRPRRRQEAIITRPDRGLLAAEFAALPPQQLLAASGPLQVVWAGAEQIPWTLREIGRLRETCFRAAGEGTGRALDLDIFDQHYRHLYVWDSQSQAVAGAYRFALVDQTLGTMGKRALYTHSLFRYGRLFLENLGTAIELGRSFVSPGYQRSYAPLLLLWKGIARFVAANPRYHVLFGPVSISNEYHPLSRELLVEFLEAHSFEAALARHVRPRRPFRRRGGRRFGQSEAHGCVRDVDTLAEVVGSIEREEKGVPVLLRQYLKLGGTLLGFNVDEDFGNALDGLILVDLLKTDPQVLQRYMGAAAAERFRRHHAAGAQDYRCAS